jgi:hypothetical protein
MVIEPPLVSAIVRNFSGSAFRQFSQLMLSIAPRRKRFSIESFRPEQSG